jgi:hypothetical protein
MVNLVVNHSPTYFVIHESDYMHKYSEVDIKEMLGFLINNIFVVFGDQIFQQTVGIPMSTNCAPLLAVLFLYSYEAEFIQKLLQEKNKPLAVAFNSTFRYIVFQQVRSSVNVPYIPRTLTSEPHFLTN